MGYLLITMFQIHKNMFLAKNFATLSVLLCATVVRDARGDNYAGLYADSIPAVVLVIPPPKDENVGVFRDYIWGIDVVKVTRDEVEITGSPRDIHFQFYNFGAEKKTDAGAYFYLIPFDQLLSATAELSDIKSGNPKIIAFEIEDSEWGNITITYRARYPDGSKSRLLEVSLGVSNLRIE